jgi:acetyl esterase/lipase
MESRRRVRLRICALPLRAFARENARAMKLLSSLLLFAFTSAAIAVPAGETLRLWAGDAPGALGQADQDIPTLTAYVPPAEKANGTAIVICPGGGYGGLAPHEGDGYATFLSDNGFACFVLKYRLGSKGYRHPAMLQDAQRAIRTVRSQAAKWNVQRVGIMGSSAGGHLASTAVTHFDAGKPDAGDPIEKASSRPDFGILCYAVISMEDGVTHGGSKTNLLGKTPAPDLVESLSNEKQVTKETPPCFVWGTWEDKAVPVENSLRFVTALQKNGIAYDSHIFQKGPHGIGLSSGKNGVAAGDVHPWGKDLLFWMKANDWSK